VDAARQPSGPRSGEPVLAPSVAGRLIGQVRDRAAAVGEGYRRRLLP
jgi:hypothetical protein